MKSLILKCTLLMVFGLFSQVTYAQAACKSAEADKTSCAKKADDTAAATTVSMEETAEATAPAKCVPGPNCRPADCSTAKVSQHQLELAPLAVNVKSEGKASCNPGCKPSATCKKSGETASKTSLAMKEAQ